MQGYVWAKTPEGELFVVLVAGGKGFVPGMENGIDMSEFFILGPVTWPDQAETQSQSSVPQSCGEPVRAATRDCVVLPFAASA